MFFKRKFEREIVKDCVVDCSSSGWTCSGQTVDLSEGGMRLEMEIIPNIHEKVELYMNCESGRQLNKKAIVVWFIKKERPEEGAIVGLKFS